MSSSPNLISPTCTPRRNRFPRFHAQQNHSLSPQKLRAPAPYFNKSRASSDTLLFRPILNQPADETEIEFESFSFWNSETKRFQKLSDAHDELLMLYLDQAYGATALRIEFPYMLVWTAQPVSDSTSLPFSIAGLVVVWMEPNEFHPGFAYLREFADSENSLKIHRLLLNKISSSNFIATRNDVRELIDFHFPAAVGIAFLEGEIIVQLPKQTEDVFNALLDVLPDHIQDGTHIHLKYMNGLLNELLDEARRECLREPGVDDPDYSDYLAESPMTLQPGVCLSGPDGDFTAGIFIQNGNQIRMLVPFHCFKSGAAHLGDPAHCSVRHADRRIGVVDGRIGETNFALAKINDNIAPSNRFLAFDTIAKSFVKSEDVIRGEKGIIDTFVARPQKLMLRGMQWVKNPTDLIVKQGRNLRPQYPFVEREGEVITPGMYTMYEQKIYTTGSPSLRFNKTIQEGSSGAAVVQIGLPGQNFLSLGKICGMIHWSNLKLKTSDSNTVIGLADGPEEIIQAGWSVANFNEVL